MDNNAFENNMINAVNGNADAARQERNERWLEQMRDYMERRKAEKFRAIVEMVCWVLCFATIVYAMGALNWLGKVPNELAIIIPAVFGLITGGRIRGLVNKI